MKKAEFEKTYARLEARVRELREKENYDSNAVRCYLIGWVTAGNNYTSAQLRKIFDLGFKTKKALTPASK